MKEAYDGMHIELDFAQNLALRQKTKFSLHIFQESNSHNAV